MARIDPLNRQTLADLEPLFQMVEASMGFLPNSMLTMARIPGLTEAMIDGMTIWQPGLKRNRCNLPMGIYNLMAGAPDSIVRSFLERSTTIAH